MNRLIKWYNKTFYMADAWNTGLLWCLLFGGIACGVWLSITLSGLNY